MPIFTVITPTYNREKYIVETIESILSQTFKDFEYLIIDDGSTDNTKKVIEHYLIDPRVKYYYHENIGEAESANRGWQLAQGKYFTQINSDDTVYPDFLEIMYMAMEDNPDYILAYPDFDIIDKYGMIIQTTKGRKWDFLARLSKFSCEAACAGTTFRKDSLKYISKLKRKGYMYINDVEMYWNLALKGDFLHVPHVLATWRKHDQHISAKRYEAIPECEDWYKKYFSQKELPLEVHAIKSKTRRSLCNYFLSLIEQSDLPQIEKDKRANTYREEIKRGIYDFLVIQISDTDIIGNKFNGHDLHLHLNREYFGSLQYICKKYSQDDTTYTLDNINCEKFFFSLVFNKHFAEADVLHLHLMNNTSFDINFLPFLSSLKPIVWTLHDPWLLGGHCIYPGNCIKFQTHCQDCQNLNFQYERTIDSSALEFYEKKLAIKNSHIVPVVASSLMQKYVENSPIFEGKKVHLVPFGIDQNLFQPDDTIKARKYFGLPEKGLIIFARTNRRYKGLGILKESLPALAKAYGKYTLLTVGENGLLTNLPKNILHKEYGWVKDDAQLVKLYQACDIFLMPSEQEAFGMMAIEAMSCAKLVLVLDVPLSALPFVVNSPECGIAVPPEEYTKTLCALAKNPSEIISRGKKSCEYARKEYSLSIYLNRLVKVYIEAKFNFKNDYHTTQTLHQISKYAHQYPTYNN